MVNPKFTTAAAAQGGYRGIMQHERAFNQTEALNELARGTAYNKSDIKTALTSFVNAAKKKLGSGLAVVISGSLRIYQTVNGHFESSVGPWDSTRNKLSVVGLSLEPLRNALKDLRPVNSTEGAKPTIDTVKCGDEYDIITSGGTTSITGKNLLIDAEKTDEFVALLKADGTIAVKGTLSVNRLTYIETTFDLSGLTAGEYTLAVYTRSGMGSEYGVAKATRKVTVMSVVA